MAIQIYLVNANAHATQHLAANFHERETSPLAEAVMTQRLPTHAIYDGALPPLKRRKTAPTRNTDTVPPSSEQISEPLAMLDDSNPPTGDATDSDLESAHDSRGRHPHMFPRACLRPRIYISTRLSIDGSCLQIADEARAGWGFTVSATTLTHLADFCGPVHCNPRHPSYLGAGRPTNITAELTAMLLALRWIRTYARGSDVTLEYDCVPAANLIRRIWKPTTNFALVLRARSALDETAGVSTISWQHVASHTGADLNERADQLAKHGASLLQPRASQPAMLACLA